MSHPNDHVFQPNEFISQHTWSKDDGKVWQTYQFFYHPYPKYTGRQRKHVRSITNTCIVFVLMNKDVIMFHTKHGKDLDTRDTICECHRELWKVDASVKTQLQLNHFIAKKYSNVYTELKDFKSHIHTTDIFFTDYFINPCLRQTGIEVLFVIKGILCSRIKGRILVDRDDRNSYCATGSITADNKFISSPHITIADIRCFRHIDDA